ncbi:DUF4279 domain-containing protein [Streptomyces sp. GD-15H]|uniref:DUF4279 domain-containing protein n=1 Tax=Streptomyces sp. GD-15H TaxID=3129112 RepID=UPI00324DE83E
MSAFRMYLRVVSQALPPEEISQRLGAEPDESTSLGSRRHPQSPPRVHATWIRRVGAADGCARPEELEPVVVGWGPELAAALGRLADSGEAAVSLEIVQEIRDLHDPQQKGIWCCQVAVVAGELRCAGGAFGRAGGILVRRS